MALSIKWNKKAFKQFDNAIAYIESDSPANGEKFKRDILHKIDKLLNYPEMYPPDKYKINKDGSFRAFEIHHYRIAYRYKKNEVLLLEYATQK